jgi:hypothetical protein
VTRLKILRATLVHFGWILGEVELSKRAECLLKSLDVKNEIRGDFRRLSSLVCVRLGENFSQRSSPGKLSLKFEVSILL